MRFYSTKAFQQDVRRLKNNKVLLKKLQRRLASINNDSGKRLSGSLHGFRAIRIDGYRLIFKIQAEKIILIALDKRKKVY